LAKQNEKTQVNISSITMERNHHQELLKGLNNQKTIIFIIVGLLITIFLFLFLNTRQKKQIQLAEGRLDNLMNIIEDALKDNEEWQKINKKL